MRANYTLARLYVPQSLTAEASIVLPKEQSHYLSTVMRKSAGDDVRLFNGSDGEYRAQIVDIARKAVTLTLKERLRAPSPAPDIWLLFAPVKKDRTAFILEKATELGVSYVQPVITARTQFAKLRLDRAQSQIIEAAEQTERLDLPELKAPVKLSKLLAKWDKSRRIIYADEAGGGEPALTGLRKTAGPCAILIGPQGGFDESERENLRRQSYVTPVSLGPRILRSDTAAISLLTLWQGVNGDWR